MLNCFQNRSTLFNNKNLNDYCRRTTDESIKNLSKRLTLERNKQTLEEDDIAKYFLKKIKLCEFQGHQYYSDFRQYHELSV